LGFVIFGFIKADLVGGIGFDVNAANERQLQLLLGFMVVIFFQWLLGMLWGHFAAKGKIDEFQQPQYFELQWWDLGLLSRAMMQWSLTKVQSRISEIRYYAQGLSTVKPGQVPETIQHRLQEEEQALTKMADGLKLRLRV